MLYTRKDHLMVNQETNEQTHYTSINKAKRASRELQTKGHIITKLRSRNTQLHIKIYRK